MESTEFLDTTTPIIVKCIIEPNPRPMPEGMLDKMPEVKVRFSNSEEKTLFEFFPDEISFDSTEFIGLTEKSAMKLKYDKDIRYLQS
jgi:hypothetical protein